MLVGAVWPGGITPPPGLRETSMGSVAPAKTRAPRSSPTAATLAVAGAWAAVALRRLRGSLLSAKMTGADAGQLVFSQQVLGVIRPQAAADRAKYGPDGQALEAARDQAEQAPGERRGQRPLHNAARVIHRRLVLRADLDDDAVQQGGALRFQLRVQAAAGLAGGLRPAEAPQ